MTPTGHLSHSNYAPKRRRRRFPGKVAGGGGCGGGTTGGALQLSAASRQLLRRSRCAMRKSSRLAARPSSAQDTCPEEAPGALPSRSALACPQRPCPIRRRAPAATRTQPPHRDVEGQAFTSLAENDSFTGRESHSSEITDTKEKKRKAAPRRSRRGTARVSPRGCMRATRNQRGAKGVPAGEGAGGRAAAGGR